MFWYFHLKDGGTPEARSVFCAPTIAAYNIMATVNLNNGSLVNVTRLNNYTTANNVTGSPLSGQAFNAYVLCHTKVWIRLNECILPQR